MKQDELAERLSKSRAAIANSMRLLKLPKEVQDYLIEGRLSMGHARALLSLEHEELQIDAAKQIAEKDLSVRETEKLVKNILNPKQSKLPIPTGQDIVYGKIEERLKDQLGTKVSLSHKKDGRGKIEIEYFSDKELKRLLELFDSIKI